jgi:hypothetical protein
LLLDLDPGEPNQCGSGSEILLTIICPPSVGRDYGTHLRERNKKEKDEEANATNDDARDGE